MPGSLSNKEKQNPFMKRSSSYANNLVTVDENKNGNILKL